MKKYREVNYSEGTCFIVPLRDAMYARGIVARLDGAGRIFGYFFGPKTVELDIDFIDIAAPLAVLSGFCGDLGLLSGRWRQLGTLCPWCREEWPIPALYREDCKAKKAWLSYYDDRTAKIVREVPEPFGLPTNKSRPHDGLMGYGALEIRLSAALA